MASTKLASTKLGLAPAWAMIMSCAMIFVATDARAQTEFDPAQIAEWRNHIFKGQTTYRLVEKDGRRAVHAACSASASGLFMERVIDLRETPILEWSWRIDELPPMTADERSRAGDDFVARIYVVRDGGLLRWRTRAISYVWANTSPEGSDWPNPYADQARMVAVRSGASGPGRWHTQRRNIREDFRRYHGLDLESIDAVAVMTDCDDSGGRAEAWYGALRFLPLD
ncbi:MAG: DUF3047 domain-containing protein [Salinarimonadaceae bacterium]|nr:MAG: DUF3047 domain-containing protein [Salinarimonadaceae bacterium]